MYGLWVFLPEIHMLLYPIIFAIILFMFPDFIYSIFTCKNTEGDQMHHIMATERLCFHNDLVTAKTFEYSLNPVKYWLMVCS